MELPTTAHAACRLKVTDYNISQLVPAIKKAADGKVAAEEPAPANLVHAHTLTIQAAMDSPVAFQEYPDGLRENPDAAIFETAVTRVMSATEACVPLELSPPTSHMVHMPFKPVTMTPKEKLVAILRSPDICMPGRVKRPFVKLPRIDVLGRDFLASSTTWDTLSWLHAALALDPDEPPTRKVNCRGDKAPFTLRAGVGITWVPDGDSAKLSFVITIHAYFDMEAVFSPLPSVGDDLRRLVLASILTGNHGVQDALGDGSFESAKTARVDALNALYDSMVPAPDFPPGFDSGILQPPPMNCRLLPFQRRTTALLLAREGAPVAGTIRRPVDGQWMRYKFGSFGDFAFQRLTGELKAMPLTKGKNKADGSDDFADETVYPRLFDTRNVEGTLLCEEMGLGKTIEAIALMLLHRHPLSVPRPLSSVIEIRPSPEVDLSRPPADFEDIEIKEWLAKENAAFANAKSWSSEAEVEVAEVAATLVVTPLPLLKQWVAEMAKHAPSLRVCVYPGWKPLIDQVSATRKKAVREREINVKREQKRKNTRVRNETRAKFAKGNGGQGINMAIEVEDASDEEDKPDISDESLLELTQRMWIDYVRGHDVVITTYQNLASDIAVAASAPKRSRRSTAKYGIEERPRSPLVMAEWWRVIMDEVQLHSDSSAASRMVSLIPRKYSLAMSGTPAKSDINDLLGSLRFLRVPVGERTMWHRLGQDANRDALHGLIKSISVRTLKADVSGEFNIPRQSRFVIPVQLSDIELHYYEDTLERQRERLRTNNDSATFRMSLRHLRQICTHIQVGALQRGALLPGDRAGRLHLGKELMTMEEALVKMSADHAAETNVITRHQLRLMIRKAQLLVLHDEYPNRLFSAITLYEQVRERGVLLMEPARARLAEVIGDREDSVDDEVDKNASQADRDRAKQIAAARATIRETLLLIHQGWFFEGDARHQLGEEAAEVNAYNTAEALRKEILARPKGLAERAIQYMEQQLAKNGEPQLAALQAADTSYRGGIATADTLEEVNALLKILNDNAVLVLSWRDKLIGFLKQPLEAEDDAVPAVGEGQTIDNPDEEYYAQALKVQGDIAAYLWAYAAVIGDRKEILLEERTLLNEHEGTVKKKRTTRAAQVAAADALPEQPDETSDLMGELHVQRQAFRDRRAEEDCMRPLKALLISLNEVAVSGTRSQEEVAIAKDASRMLREFISSQSEMITKLNKELDLFGATYNRRVTYFASLQEISDSVRPPMFTNLEADIETASASILAREAVLARMAVRGRYLNFLGQNDGQDREDCTICFGTSDDEFAILLDCGHAFCVSCFREYRKSPYIGSRCATCKAAIPDKKLTRIRIKPEEPKAVESAESSRMEVDGEQEETQDADTLDDAENEQRVEDMRKLNYLSDVQLRAIADLDMMGDYGSKINILIKHLKLYRIQQPNVRHVVFSNWADSLHIVEQALRVNHIRFVSLDANSKKNDVVSQFHADEGITVFLLHAERESAGLTLTSCAAVHLLEPVLQHSFELQAVGRVDRLGQTQNTSVFCYATMDTVESRILSQGVRNGTSIYLEDWEADKEAMSRMPRVAHAAGSGGDISDVSTVDDALVKLIF